MKGREKILHYRRSIQGSMRDRRYAVGVFIFIFLVWAVVLGLVSTRANNAIDQQAARQLIEMEELDKRIQEMKDKKEQERLKKKEADEAEETKNEAENNLEEAPQSPEVSNNSNSSAGCNSSTVHNNPVSVDVLVNKKHCLMPLGFIPPDLVTIHGATISAKAAGDFTKMFEAAAAAGQPFTVSSSYRSYETQVSTYNYWVSINGQQMADTVSARPGYSEHQTGLAFDASVGGCTLECFASTSQYQWFKENASKYGFVQRYIKGYEGITGYSAEEWHFRYVGVAVAEDMKAKGIYTLEQYWGMDGGLYP